MSLDKIVDQEVKVDVLIIGSEAAGSKTAIELDELGVKDVLMVTKGLFAKSGVTLMAGWAVQAALGHMDPRDNPEVHLEDVVKGGGYLVNQKLSEVLVNAAITEVPKLEKWGAKFLKIGDKFLQIQAPGSTYPRSLHSYGLHGGIQWRKAYKSEVMRRRIRVMEDVFLTDLLLSDDGAAGAVGFSIRDGHFILFRAKLVVLATGGMAQIFSVTDAAMEATGDGMAMAFRAGGELMDMEFLQFFPLGCYWPDVSRVKGVYPADLRYTLHARFYNALGEQFLERYMPMAKEWGLRDPTSRAIYLEAKYGRGSPHGGAWIAINHLPRNVIDNWIKTQHGEEKRWYWTKLEQMGIDLKQDALECGPVSHYTMGGVRVDEKCETTIPRVFAAGEVAAGMDGAERIDAGPAITWTQTMGYVVAKEVAKKLKGLDWAKLDEGQVREKYERTYAPLSRQKGVRGCKIKRDIQDAMWECCSLVRDEKTMEEGLKKINKIIEEDIPRVSVAKSSKVFNKDWVEAHEAMNMAQLAEISIRAALMRKESRKSHYRTDYPKMDNENWLVNIIAKKDGEKVKLITTPPVITKIKPEPEHSEG